MTPKSSSNSSNSASWPFRIKNRQKDGYPSLHRLLDKQLAAKIASGDAATLTVPELIRAAGSLRRQLDTVKFSGDTLSPDPEPADPTDWSFKPNSTWFAPKQKP